MTDVNNEQTSEIARDPESGRFLAGNSGNGGRKPGSRNKLAEAFICDLHEEWARSGPDVLKRLARDDPGAFTRVVAGVLPRELDASLSLTVEHIDLMREARTFAEAFRLSQRLIGGELSLMTRPRRSRSSPMLPDPETEAPDPLAALQTLAEIFGFTYSRLGEKGLRTVLEQHVADANDKPLEDIPYFREALEDAVDQLRDVGLGKAAKIVAEYPERFPPSIECNPHPADSCNGKGWLMSLAAWQHHRQWQRRKRRVA